ncbi:MAG: hypothetical protein JO362_07715 [Streptomycetaceae bacterium]|nr:hypothetical protein [Streptomycetaceae bacterium]
MRNDFTPIATCEIDDAELDNVSGGSFDTSIPTYIPIVTPTNLPIITPTNLPVSTPTNLPINMPLGL